MTTNEILILVFMPLVSGAIGWFTNLLAVKMLLRPRQPIFVLGLRIQGLLPRRQVELAERISEAISKQFITEEDIVQLLKKVDPVEALRHLIITKWDDKIGEILETMPFIQMFLSPEKMIEIRDRIAVAFSGESDAFIRFLGHSLEGKLDLKETIRQKILAFDLDKLDRIIHDIARREFREIEFLGGVVGFLIGLVQAVLVIWVLPR